ncbi:MAG TPA: LysR substrate-binding domain-containing protein [Crinalium sp.]
MRTAIYQGIAVEIYQLKVFLEVARCLSFTEAADALNLTQPAVSAKIRSLESDLGTSLFHRLGRRVELTTVGEYLLDKGRELTDLEARLVRDIEEIKNGKFSTLRIGCIANAASHWLPTLLFRYRQQYPDVQTKCLTFDSADQLYRAMTSGDVDVGISDLSFSGFDEISETIIDTIYYSLAVSASHELAQYPWLSIKELRNYAWVLPPEGFPARIILERRLEELGLSLSSFSKIEVVDSPNLLRTYLLEGHYLSFAPNVEFQMEQQTHLVKMVPLEEFALGTPVFLLLPRRFSPCLEPQVQPCSYRKLGLEPIQNFVKLLQDGIQPFGKRELRERKSSSAPTGIAPQILAEASDPSHPAAWCVHPNPCPKMARFQAPRVQGRSPSTQPARTLTLTIGTQNHTIQTVTAGLIIQRLGLLEHFLPQEGRYSDTQYQIQWWDYSSGAPILAGLHDKHIDIGVLGDYPLLLSAAPQHSETLADTRLISFVASNPDGAANDVIVPHRSLLNSFEDLKGRVIAVPFSSAAHGMIMRSLHRNDLLDDVKLTSIDTLNPRTLNTHTLNQRAQAVDGYAYFAPFHEIAKHKGGFRRLFEGEVDRLPTFHGVVVQQALAETYPEVVVAYLKALLAAQYWYISTPLAPTLVSRWVNLDAAIVAKTLCVRDRDYAEGIYFPETQIRLDWVNEHLRQLAMIVGNEHLRQINLDRWVQPEFLEQAMATL